MRVKIFCLDSCMSPPRLIPPYHFWEKLVCWGGPFNSTEPLVSSWRRMTVTTPGLPFSDKKNYSAKYRTRRNRRQFRRNSACFAEENHLGIPFQTISRKRKTLGIPFQTISWMRKTLVFHSGPILEEKKLRNFVPNQFPVTENTLKSIPNQFWEQKTLQKNHFC